MRTRLTVEEVAAKFGAPADNVRAQFRKNAAHIRVVIAALEAGRPSSNYTTADLPMLRNSAAEYERRGQVCAS